jgi:hypothetical protein
MVINNDGCAVRAVRFDTEGAEKALCAPDVFCRMLNSMLQVLLFLEMRFEDFVD